MTEETSARLLAAGRVSVPDEGKPYSRDASAWPRGEGAALSSGPAVYASVKPNSRPVDELPDHWLSGYRRNSPPNLKSCAPLILSNVTAADCVWVCLKS